MLHELLPRYKIGDVVVYGETVIDSKEILMQAKILGATAELEDDKWVWSYQIESVNDDLVIFLQEEQIIANLSDSL